MFEQTFVREGAAQRPWTFAVSSAAQAAMIGLLLLLTVFRTEMLPKAFSVMRIGVPLGPAPAPAQVQSRSQSAGTASFAVPSRRALVLPASPAPVTTMVSERIIGLAPGMGTAGSIPGGLPAGEFGGVLTRAHPSPPPPPPPQPKAPEEPSPIRIGGDVQAAKLIRQVKPEYPLLARQARIQGTVRLNALISTEGMVRNLTVESGPPMLIRAAVEAVSQWRYAPTLLNGRPVEVVTQIEVNFRLGF